MLNPHEDLRNIVETVRPLSEADIVEAEQQLGRPLPRSLRTWLLEFGDEARLIGGKGNFFMNRLSAVGPDDEIVSIVGAAQALQEAGWPVDESYVVFAADGMEDLFALYLGAHFDGEPPVVKVSIDEEAPYWLMATSFGAFVRTYLPFEAFRSELPDEDADDEELLLRRASALFTTHDPKLDATAILNMYDSVNAAELNRRVAVAGGVLRETT